MRAENSPVPVLLTPRAPLGACQLQGRLRSSSTSWRCPQASVTLTRVPTPGSLGWGTQGTGGTATSPATSRGVPRSPEG